MDGNGQWITARQGNRIHPGDIFSSGAFPASDGAERKQPQRGPFSGSGLDSGMDLCADGFQDSKGNPHGKSPGNLSVGCCFILSAVLDQCSVFLRIYHIHGGDLYAETEAEFYRRASFAGPGILHESQRAEKPCQGYGRNLLVCASSGSRGAAVKRRGSGIFRNLDYLLSVERVRPGQPASAGFAASYKEE